MAYPTYTGEEVEAFWKTASDNSTAIKAITDALPDAGALTNITNKVNDLFAHTASGARWMGASAGPAAPGLATSLLPWTATAHDDPSTFGTMIEVFDGTEDFDYPSTPTAFHPHKILFVDIDTDDTVWKLRFANSGYNGSTHTYANMAAAVTASKYTDLVVQINNANRPAIAVDFHAGLATVGSKLWVQVMMKMR